MSYVDGFIVPVPKKNVEAYTAIAKKSAAIWREHGALDYQEWIADDVKTGEHTSFPQSVKLEADEIVIFSWITYKSREHRDQVNAKVMSDPRIKDEMGPDKMPFDGKRMIYGGFAPLFKP